MFSIYPEDIGCIGGIAVTIFRKCFMEMNWFTNLCAVVGLCEPDWTGWADRTFDDLDTNGYTTGPLFNR